MRGTLTVRVTGTSLATVLLAALARARGIPSRAAVGLVYVGALKGFGYHMWTEVWQIAGIASEIPEHEDFFVYKIGVEEVLVVRQKDKTIKAFYNVCPHR